MASPQTHIIAISADSSSSRVLDREGVLGIIQVAADEICGFCDVVWGHTLSGHLWASKGSYYVVAGTFNYHGWERMSELAQKVSAALCCWVVHLHWDEMSDGLRVALWHGGSQRERRPQETLEERCAKLEVELKRRQEGHQREHDRQLDRIKALQQELSELRKDF